MAGQVEIVPVFDSRFDGRFKERVAGVSVLRRNGRRGGPRSFIAQRLNKNAVRADGGPFAAMRRRKPIDSVRRKFSHGRFGAGRRRVDGQKQDASRSQRFAFERNSAAHRGELHTWAAAAKRRKRNKQ